MQAHQAHSLVAVCKQKSSGAKAARYEVRAIEDSLADNSDKLCGSDGEVVDGHSGVGVCDISPVIRKIRSF
jgi:hypothetical protein